MGISIRKLNVLESLHKKGIDIFFTPNVKDIPYDYLRQIETNPRLLNFLSGPVIDTADFSKFSEMEKETLELISPEEATTAARETLPIARKFKDFLDKKFGKDKYTFVSIGRSPVMVGRGLEGMGVDAKYIPISNVRKACNADCDDIPVSDMLHELNRENYIKFLTSIGLNADSVIKSGKTVVFYDYTCSGKTLDIMAEFFKKIMGFSFFEFRYDFRSINKDLRKMFTKHQVTDFTAIQYIKKYLYGSLSGKFAHIPKLDFSDTNNIFEAIKGFEPDHQVRFFNFNILNMLEKAGLLVQKQN